MRKILATALLLLLVSACTLTPRPITSCESVPFCAQVPARYSLNQGMPAKYTVQNMLHSLLIGGKPADPSDWPASVYATSADGACSATLVGDRALILAAHCMNDGAKVSFSAHANNYTATCSHNPHYTGDKTSDWALCVPDRPVTGVAFEVLGISEKLSMGQEVLLTGYGCVNVGGGGGNDGIFRIGTAKVTELPIRSNDFVTLGGAALCFGDSGGAAYVQHSDGSRIIFAINSRGNIKDQSNIVQIAAQGFIDWAKEWTKNTSIRICGIHPDAEYCRTGAEAPPPDSRFEISNGAACIKGVMAPEFLGIKNDVVKEVEEILNKHLEAK